MPQLKMWRTAWVAAVLCAAAVGSHAQTFTNLASFNGTNGANPNYGSLVQGLDGNYYGTTAYGGANNQGTVFKVTADGTLTTLYSFCSQPNCSDGANPWVGLTLGSDGNFYGTTVNGGSGILIGAGTVFQITPAGQLNTIHRFCGAGKECSDGASPTSGLVEGIDGNFYGTTAGGGGYYDNGTIFKIASCGTFTKLYTFGVLGIGGLPSGLMLATDGNVYGTGGGGGGPYGEGGMVFEITAEGTFTTVYNFCSQPNCDDGSEPIGGVIEGADGNFFGATYTGRGYGTIYELTRSGTLTSRYTFCRQMPYCTDGYEPTGFLVQGADGNFYGTTVQGGIPGPCLPGFYSCGTVFELTTTGTRITLHDFCSEAGCADGLWPYAGLVQGTDGNFYGETYYGGTSNNGTVFKLSTGLGPFVKTLPTFGTVGANAIILGNNLTGASSVTFNGVPTKFQVESDTAIRAVVPSAATSGPVQVVTPGGTLTSNVVFRVLP